MNCEKHPEVAGTLAVDLPSINVRRYLCEPCKDALRAVLSKYKGKREAWERESDYSFSGRSLWVRGTGGYDVLVQTFDQGEKFK